MNILLFGGTSDGRELAQKLAETGAAVTVSVATEYGRELLEDIPGLTVLTGRRGPEEMAGLINGFDLCVDATHPYAVEATRNIRAACLETGVPYRRCLREGSGPGRWHMVGSAEEAASLAESLPGNILLTTGAKELPAFAGLDPRRLFARVLPSHEGLAACEAMGLLKKNTIAMQGPFSQKLNEALMEQLHIRVLVTKDGDPAGGFPEKAAAAQRLGVALIVISRPEESGVTAEEILREVKGRMA